MKEKITGYDVISDVHGCIDELNELITKLGYTKNTRPGGRQLLFVGDLNDRGPDTAAVYELAMSLQSEGIAQFVLGNHDWKLLRVLKSHHRKEEFRGNISKDLGVALTQIYAKGPLFTKQVFQFLNGLRSMIKITGEPGLIVVHGAYDASKLDKEARDFHLYGETDGQTEDGFPRRTYKWREKHTGTETIVFGHDPLYDLTRREAVNKYQTPAGALICGIDYGCVFGGELAAYRYPENEIVTVKAKRMYKNPKRK